MNSSGKGLIIFDFIVTRRKLLYQDENAQLRICCSVSGGKGSEVAVTSGDPRFPVGAGILTERKREKIWRKSRYNTSF